MEATVFVTLHIERKEGQMFKNCIIFVSEVD